MAAAKQAVIVGINEYKDRTIPALKGAEQDAKEIKEILTHHGDFSVADNHFLVGEHATHEAVLGSISDLLWKTDPSDVTLFYFSGHGIEDSYGSGYLAPYDMVKQQPLVHGIEMQGLRELALKSRNKEAVVLILDCCYAGVAADSKAKGSIEALRTAENCFSGMGEVEPTKEVAEGVFILSSSAADQSSRELSGCQHKLGKEEAHDHGAFTFHLIEGLSGLAAGEGELISVKTLRDYVDQQGKGNPNQTFKLYASRETNASSIILARATDVVQLSASLEKITEHLTANDYPRLILAGDDLCRVLGNRPNYQAAKDARKQLEERLDPCKRDSLRWLQRNKLALMQHNRSACSRLETLVAALSLELIESLRSKPDEMLGLLITVVDAAQNNWPVEKLLPLLQASESPLTPSPSQLRLTPSPSQLRKGVRGVR